MSPIMLAYGALGGAIVFEVVGSTCLQKSEQFTRLGPSLATVVFYLSSFYCLSQALKSIPLGIAYAVWAGLGMVLTAVAGAVVLGQKLDAGALAGIALIIGGVVVMNLFSQSVAH